MRIRLVAQPVSTVAGRENERHAVVDFGHQLVGMRRDDGEREDPFARGRVLPVLPQTAKAKGRAVLHGDGIRLLGLLPLDRLPFEEAIDRDDEAPPSINTHLSPSSR